MTCEFCAGTVNHRVLGTTLRAWRLRLGLKQSWVAAEMGVTYSWLSQLERGRKRFWTMRTMNRYVDVCEAEERKRTGQYV